MAIAPDHIFSKAEVEHDFQTVADYADMLGRAYIVGEDDAPFVLMSFDELERWMENSNDIMDEIKEIYELVSH